MYGILNFVAVGAGAVGLAAVLDCLRAYFYIPKPSHQPSPEELGLPRGFRKLLNMRDVAMNKVGHGGRRLRRGLLFRSAKLHKLPAEDLEELRRLGIKFVADFRTPAEQQKEPDTFAPGHQVAHRLFVTINGDPREMMKEVLLDPRASLADQKMKEVNRDFVTLFASQFRAFLEALAQADGTPALVHCTAGKDRTGWATALLLFALGVAEEDILQDYLLSNQLWYKQARVYMLLIRVVSLFRVPLEKIMPLLVLRRAFLSEAIAAAQASHGSMERYLIAPDGLGLSENVIARLRDIFLENDVKN